MDFARLLQLRRFRRYDTSMKQEFWEKIKILYEKFRLSTVTFKDST
ncbi:10282_t:CDS:1, partial [Scutellospora calospora]